MRAALKTERQRKEGPSVNMEHFFEQVQLMNDDIDSLSTARQAIDGLHHAALQAVTSQKEKEYNCQVTQLIAKSQNMFKTAKKQLIAITDENKNLKDDNRVRPTDLRVRENLCNALTRKLLDEMQLYQHAQQTYRQNIKSKTTREIKILKPDIADEEVEAIMSSESSRDALYKEFILHGTINDRVKAACIQAAGRHQDIVTLERRLAELHQMFTDLATLTGRIEQSRILDQIEFHVKQAGDHVEKGYVNLCKSLEYQSRIRKKKRRLVVIIAMVTALVVPIKLSAL